MSKIKLFTSYSALMSCHHLLLFFINRLGTMTSIWCIIIPHSGCRRSQVKIAIILHDRGLYKGKNISMDIPGKINTTPKDGQVHRAVFKHNPEMGWGSRLYTVWTHLYEFFNLSCKFYKLVFMKSYLHNSMSSTNKK